MDNTFSASKYLIKPENSLPSINEFTSKIFTNEVFDNLDDSGKKSAINAKVCILITNKTEENTINNKDLYFNT